MLIKVPFWPSSAQTALVMQRCKHRRKFCFVVLPLPKKFFDTFWEPCSSRRLGLVPSAHSFRAATSEHTTPRRNRVMRPSSRNGSTPYLNSVYGKRVQATFTPVLLHYIIAISISQWKYKHLFVMFCRNLSDFFYRYANNRF